MTAVTRAALRRWRPLSLAAVFIVLTVNAWRDAGTVVLLFLAAAAVGLLLVVAVVMAASGSSVVHHSRQVEKAIEKVHGPKAVTSARSTRGITR